MFNEFEPTDLSQWFEYIQAHSGVFRKQLDTVMVTHGATIAAVRM